MWVVEKNALHRSLFHLILLFAWDCFPPPHPWLWSSLADSFGLALLAGLCSHWTLGAPSCCSVGLWESCIFDRCDLVLQRREDAYFEGSICGLCSFLQSFIKSLNLMHIFFIFIYFFSQGLKGSVLICSFGYTCWGRQDILGTPAILKSLTDCKLPGI